MISDRVAKILISFTWVLTLLCAWVSMYGAFLLLTSPDSAVFAFVYALFFAPTVVLASAAAWLSSHIKKNGKY